MNTAALRNEDNATAPVLYMALELSNKSWRLAFGDGAKRRQVSVPAADLAALAGAVAKAKERFKMPASVRVVSCYEAGRDGFWLHRHLVSMGVENQVVDAASIEVSRRLRHVKTDRLYGERHRHRGAGAAIADCAVALPRRRRDSRGCTAHRLRDLSNQGSQPQELAALKVGRSARDFPGPRHVRRRPDRGGASSASGSSCPLGASAASGARPTTPTRIEGGDERIALALTIESGQPT